MVGIGRRAVPALHGFLLVFLDKTPILHCELKIPSPGLRLAGYRRGFGQIVAGYFDDGSEFHDRDSTRQHIDFVFGLPRRSQG